MEMWKNNVIYATLRRNWILDNEWDKHFLTSGVKKILENGKWLRWKKYVMGGAKMNMVDEIENEWV